MRAQRPVGLAVSWLRLTWVFLLDVALLVAASHWPGPARQATYAWWTGVGLAVLVAVVALVTYRHVPLGSALLGVLRARFADLESTLSTDGASVTGHQHRFGREEVGIREHDGRLVSVIAVAEAAAALPGRHQREPDSAALLPVTHVAAGLRQFDVRFDSIDIVAVETGADNSGERNRRTWLVLRMDPQRNVAAVAARDSVAAVLAAATERLAHQIDGRLVTASPVRGDGLAEMDAAVRSGLQPAQLRPRRRRRGGQPDGGAGYATSFWVSPRDITGETLAGLWRADTRATVMTIRLAGHHGRTEISVVVRYHTDDRLTKEQRAGLNRLTGRQVPAASAGLAMPARHAPLVVPARELADHEPLSVEVGHAQHAGSQLEPQP